VSAAAIPDSGRIRRRRVADLHEHPQAGRVPPPGAETCAALRDDIAAHGVQVPLEVTSGGVVLDGRARLQIARELAITHVEVVTIDPADEVEHMLRRALHRRQLTPSQQAAIAVSLLDHQQLREHAHQRQQANLRQGDREPERASLPARGERTRDLVAKLSGAGARTVQDALTVADNDPALLARVTAGELSASTAASKVRRAIRDAQIPPAPPMPDGPFELIYADPPWRLGSPDSDHAPNSTTRRWRPPRSKRSPSPPATTASCSLGGQLPPRPRTRGDPRLGIPLPQQPRLDQKRDRPRRLAPPTPRTPPYRHQRQPLAPRAPRTRRLRHPSRTHPPLRKTRPSLPTDRADVPPPHQARALRPRHPPTRLDELGQPGPPHTPSTSRNQRARSRPRQPRPPDSPSDEAASGKPRRQ
jgi:ParB-like chromosome segregation protein Spo0J